MCVPQKVVGRHNPEAISPGGRLSIADQQHNHTPRANITDGNGAHTGNTWNSLNVNTALRVCAQLGLFLVAIRNSLSPDN